MLLSLLNYSRASITPTFGRLVVGRSVENRQPRVTLYKMSLDISVWLTKDPNKCFISNYIVTWCTKYNNTCISISSDKSGKEVVTRYDANLPTAGVFYTDANGREIQERK